MRDRIFSPVASLAASSIALTVSLALLILRFPIAALLILTVNLAWGLIFFTVSFEVSFNARFFVIFVTCICSPFPSLFIFARVEQPALPASSKNEERPSQNGPPPSTQWPGIWPTGFFYPIGYRGPGIEGTEQQIVPHFQNNWIFSRFSPGSANHRLIHSGSYEIVTAVTATN